MVIAFPRASRIAAALAGVLVAPAWAADPATLLPYPRSLEQTRTTTYTMTPIAQLPSPASPDTAPAGERRVLRVTAYCDRGLTAAGVPSGLGQCAAPADVPFGSIVHIPELGQSFVVTDRTAERFRHNTIDIFMPSREACLQFGRHYLDVEIREPAAAHRYGCRQLLTKAARVSDDTPN